MSVAPYEGVAAPQTGEIKQEDFSGGWNPSDADSQVADNESPDCVNMTLDERGGAVKRLGLEETGVLAGVGQEMFEWKAEQKIVVQIGAAVYVGGDLSSLSLVHTFSTSAKAAFCDFLSKLVCVHPIDGVFMYATSGGWSQQAGGDHNMEYVRGTAIIPWQNVCLVTGDPRPDFRSYVWRSALADASKWDVSATGDWVALREKDDASLVGFGSQGGQDVVGKPGLLVAKNQSLYRINDPSTLAYTTLDAEAGAAGPKAITELLGLTVMLNDKGIWATDGVSQPELVSGKIRRLFTDGQLSPTALSKVAAGVHRDRVLFSIPRITDDEPSPTVNNYTLEFHPGLGWIVPHDFGCAAFANNPGTSRVVGLSPSADKAFTVFKGGADLGADIAARYQTRWFEPTRGIKNRFRRMRLSGRGRFDLYVRRDYTLGKGDLEEVNLSTGGFVWNNFKWNDGSKWGPSQYEAYLDVWSLGVAKSISFAFEETGSSSATSRKILGDGTAAEAGAFAVYGFLADFIKLGSA